MRHRSSVCALLVACPGLAGAQAPTSGTRARDTLAAAVITATRVAVTTAAPIATTTVLRADELRARGITRLADALTLVPGLVVLGSGAVGSQTSVFLRGGNSNYVRVLVDGVPVNDPGGFIDIANLTIAGLDRVEVVRGPVSVLYGSDAVTGVIQLFTRDGAGTSSWRALGGAGSVGARRAELGVAGGRSHARYALDASTQATDGILPFNNRYTNDVLGGSLRFVPGSRTDARLSARWSGVVYHYPTDYSGAVVDRNAEQLDHRLVASVDAGQRFGERVEVRTTITSNEFLPRTNDGPDDAADTLGFSGYFARTVRTNRAADARVNIRIRATHSLTVGTEVSHERERTSSRSLSEFGTSADGFEASRHNAGLYAQAVGDAGRRVSYAVGARQDRNSAFGTFGTARASLGLVAGRNARLRAAVGTAFKAPSFYENFSTGFVVGNRALRPEESRSAEVGLDLFRPDGDFTLSVVGYAQRFRNIVQYASVAPSPGGPNYFNVAGASADGAEVAVRWDLAERLGVGVSYAYTATRVTETGFDSSAGAQYVQGEALVRRPPHALTASVTRMFGSGGSARLTATHVGERGDRDFTEYPAKPVTLPGFTRFDVSLTVPVAAPGVTAIVRVDNALDARIEEIVRFAAPGRTLFIGIEWRR